MIHISGKCKDTPTFFITGDRLTHGLRLNAGTYEAPQDREAVFLTSPMASGCSMAEIAAQNHAALTRLFTDAGISLKPTNRWFVALEDPNDFDKAMGLLDWPASMQIQFMGVLEAVEERRREKHAEDIQTLLHVGRPPDAALS